MEDSEEIIHVDIGSERVELVQICANLYCAPLS